MPLKITILGLGRIGASIGLALAKIKDQAIRVGNDREPLVMRQAEKIGAVDKTTINLPTAVRDADVIIMALPVDEIHDTMNVIAQDLKSGAVLIDTSPVKSAVMQWAEEILPADDRYFVALTPSLNPAYIKEVSQKIDEAHADLFQNSLMLITTPSGTDESALELATNLTKILGASPIYADTSEVDGLIANCDLLPRLVSAALVNTTVGQPGWHETQKLAGYAYAQASELALYPEESKALGTSALLNSENAVRMINQMIEELHTLREAISANDANALQQRLEHARGVREDWINHRMAANWEGQSNVRVPSGGEMIGKLFGVRPRKDSTEK